MVFCDILNLANAQSIAVVTRTSAYILPLNYQVYTATSTYSKSEPNAESVPEMPSDFSQSFHLRIVSASLPSTQKNTLYSLHRYFMRRYNQNM